MRCCIEKIRLKEPLKGVRLGADPRSQAEWEQRLRARYEQGLRDGEKALREQLLQQRADVLAVQQGVLESLRQCLPKTRGECEAALIELAMEAARKLVSGMPIVPEMVAGAVREALEHVEETHSINVLLHPEDYELLRRVNDPVLLTEAGGEKISFQASSDVTRGGCVIQTRFGLLDARRETKLDMLKQSLAT